MKIGRTYIVENIDRKVIKLANRIVKKRIYITYTIELVNVKKRVIALVNKIGIKKPIGKSIYLEGLYLPLLAQEELL